MKSQFIRLKKYKRCYDIFINKNQFYYHLKIYRKKVDIKLLRIIRIDIIIRSSRVIKIDIELLKILISIIKKVENKDEFNIIKMSFSLFFNIDNSIIKFIIK